MNHSYADDEPRSKQREAWNGDPPQPSAARERLLSVAACCVARNGIAGTGVAQVALEAGVSRPTVRLLSFWWIKSSGKFTKCVCLSKSGSTKF